MKLSKRPVPFLQKILSQKMLKLDFGREQTPPATSWLTSPLN